MQDMFGMEVSDPCSPWITLFVTAPGAVPEMGLQGFEILVLRRITLFVDWLASQSPDVKEFRSLFSRITLATSMLTGPLKWHGGKVSILVPLDRALRPLIPNIAVNPAKVSNSDAPLFYSWITLFVGLPWAGVIWMTD